MTADIIDIKSRQKPNLGNGAREALLDIATAYADYNGARPLFGATSFASVERLTDCLLAELWTRGFKVVPLDGSE